MRRPVSITMLALALLAAAACSTSGPTHATPAVTTPDPTPLTYAKTVLKHRSGFLQIEIAETDQQRERGLSYRDSLPRSEGMLFDLGQSIVPAFWMKAMRFPLDMVWIGEDKKIVSVTKDVPAEPNVPDGQLKKYSPSVPVRWVLELNAGAVGRFGLNPGDQLEFSVPASPQPTP